MNILATLKQKAGERQLPFMVIGGLAINAHGTPGRRPMWT